MKLKEGINEVSPKDFVERVDSFFEQYLSVEAKDEDFGHVAEVLLDIFRERFRISKLITDVLDDVDWNSEESFSEKEFLEFLDKVGGFFDKYYFKDSARYLKDAFSSQTAPIVITGREVLEDDRIEFVHMQMFYRFSSFLKDLYFEEEKKEGMDLVKEVEISQEFLVFFARFILYMRCANLDEEFKKSLLHSLCAVKNEGVVSAEELDKFNKGVEEMLIDNFDASSTDPISGLLRDLKNVFEETLPGVWVSSVSEEKYRSVFLGGDFGNFYVLSVDNFYFDEICDEDFCEVDEFPFSSQIASRDRYRDLVGRSKDVSVFDANGKKVFWGDLLPENIVGLKGTYYVLDQKTSLHDVPEWAVKVESMNVSDDPNRPEGAFVDLMPRDKIALDPDYVRIKALGKVKNGEFIENSPS